MYNPLRPVNGFRRLGLVVMLPMIQATSTAAFTEVESYKEGREVEGYRVVSVYLDALEKPAGARYRHPNGMTVDILRSPSVPQVSIDFGTLPTSDMGEPHTQEHLLLGKGRVGKSMNSLMSMSLGKHTAATYAELTNYQFQTTAGKDAFYRLLEKYLEALIRPDYTDEEIRREVANLEVLQDPKTGRSDLEEKGTVYTEMVSASEKADYVNWYQLAPLLYGKDSPMALDSGGAPAGIRRLVPEDIRRFHKANYHFGSNLSMIAVLPPDYSPSQFLARLNAIMDAVEPEARAAAEGCLPAAGADTKPCARYPELPPFRPAEGAPILIGSFPNEDPNLPQNVAMSFRPLKKTPTPREALELELFLSVLGGGDTSILYRDLVDEAARKFDSGVTNMGAYLSEPPADVPMLDLSGLPPSHLTEAKLGEIRAVVMGRIRELAAAGKGSKLLKEFNAKALSLLSSSRRGTLKFIDAPPRFGSRHSGIAWHRHLDALHRGPGFRKPLAYTPYFDGVEKELSGGGNPWKKVIKSCRLLEPPFVSAVLPDKALLERERTEKAERLKAHEERLMKEYGVTEPQVALARYKESIDAKTAELETRDKGIEKPGFVGDPPMTLDDSIAWEEGVLSGSVRLVRSHFPSTPFTDLDLFFDLSVFSGEDLAYLPVLPSLLTDLGVRTAEGERLDYSALRERWRSEIYALSAGISTNPRKGRVELSVFASGAGPEENAKAARWLEDSLLRADVSAATAGRLRTVLRERIRGLRRIFQMSEENWVTDAADAYRYQSDLPWMSVASPFTELQLLNRVYFRLAGYPEDKTRALVEELLDDLSRGLKEGSRGRLEGRLQRLASGTGLNPVLPASRYLQEIGEFLDSELALQPEATWREDIGRLIRETRSDLRRDPAAEMERMRGLLSRVLTRANASAAMTGDPGNVGAAVPLLKALVDKLPEGTPRRTAAAAEAAPQSSEAALPRDNPRSVGVVLGRLKGRYGDLAASPVHAALVNNNTKTGVFVLSAKGPSYDDASPSQALDFLAAEVFQGAAPHTFFLKTWGAGLAYSNGIRPSASRGLVLYYAERCPDLVATMRFVVSLAKGTRLDDPFFVDFALANCFSDYRGAEGFSSRGLALRADLTDGRPPELVRRFKQALLDAARAPGALERIRERVPGVLGSVLVGLGRKMSEAPEASGFVIGPDGLLDQYERFLVDSGETKRLIRLYPRDFWLPEN